MRRGYRRERRDASLDEQDKSLREAGIDLTGDHPPVYTDFIKDTGSHKALAERRLAINSLRNHDKDEIVVHDAATLGRDHQEIIEAAAAIGQTGCKLIVWRPFPREFVWHPDAAEIAALAAEGVTILRSARGKVSNGKVLGAAPKLVGNVLDVAKAAWADPDLTAKQVVSKVFDLTGVQISSRLLFSKLGTKSKAEMQTLRPPMPPPVQSKKKACRPEKNGPRHVTGYAWIYVMQRADNIRKVGCTIDVPDRRRQLHAGTQVAHQFEKAWRMPEAEARLAERLVHLKLKPSLVRGRKSTEVSDIG